MTKPIRNLKEAKAIMESDTTVTVCFKKPVNIQLFTKAIARNKNPKLTTLDLSGSNLSDPNAVKALVAALNNNPQITTVILDNCSIGIGARFFKELKHVTNLSLSNNNFYSSHLGLNPAIRELNLNGNPISDKGIEVVTRNTKITSLSISNCNITNKAMDNIVRLDNLSTLDISFNDVETQGVCKVLSHCKNLKTLDTAGNIDMRDISVYDIEDTNIFKTIMQPLISNQLTSLNLPSSFPAATQLEIMEHSPNLTTLNGNSREEAKTKLKATLLTIAEFKITDRDNKSIEKMFDDNKRSTIQHVIANNLQLTDGGAMAIAKAIESSKCKVEHLSLRGNNISTLGWMLLLNATPAIKSLDLSYNKITGIPGLEYIGTADEEKFFGNGQRGDSYKQFKDAIFTDNKELKSLDLRGNNLSDAFLLKIMECRPSLEVLNDKPCAELKKEIENRLNPKTVSQEERIQQWKDQKASSQQEKPHPIIIKDRKSVLLKYMNDMIATDINPTRSHHHRRMSSTAA